MTAEGDIGVDVDVLIEDSAWRRFLPDLEDHCRRAVDAALAGRIDRTRCEVSILLTDDAHMTALNRQFRQRATPTNVLSFPAGPTPAAASATRYLGDIALARQTVASEAAAQGKTVADHLSHLVVHGTLHLLGLDHQTDADAERMEALEIGVLKNLGINDPYETLGNPRD